MKSYKNCAKGCSCANGCIEGTVMYRCNYGNCSGYKCQNCGQWSQSNIGENCSEYSTKEINSSMEVK